MRTIAYPSREISGLPPVEVHVAGTTLAAGPPREVEVVPDVVLLATRVAPTARLEVRG